MDNTQTNNNKHSKGISKSQIGKPPNIVNQVSGCKQKQLSFIKPQNQQQISLTVSIKDNLKTTKENQETKYNDFIQSLRENHFPELNKEIQLILTSRWNPIIPQSINSTIKETLLDPVPQLKLWILNDYISEIVKRFNELQEPNQQQRDLIEKDVMKIKYLEQETKYNELSQQFTSMESNCQEYLGKIHKILNLKENSKNLLPMDQLNYIVDKKAAVPQNVLKQLQIQKQQIEELNMFISQFSQEYLKFNNQVAQFEKNQKQIIIQQTSNSNEQYQSKNSKIKIFPTTKTIEQQIQQFQENFHSSKEIKKDNSESSSQLSNCSYCNKGCPEYVELPCLQRYHQQCFEELGRKSMDQSPSVQCKCSMKIQTKLFAKETQFLLLAHQASLIFQNYRNPLSLNKCKDCEFFYKIEIKSYCPNCLKFTIES